MTDKVQKIRNEVGKLQNELIQEREKGFGSDTDDACILELQNVLTYIDSLQEEPISNIWHDASEKSNELEEVVIINPSDNTGEVLTKCTSVYQGRIWAYTSDLLQISNPCKIGKNLQEEPVSELLNAESMIESYKQRLISQTNGVKNSPLIDMCLASYKHGVNETLDTLKLSNLVEPVSGDLEEASKKYALNNTPWDDCKDEMQESFKAGANWQKEQMMKDAINGYVIEDVEEGEGDFLLSTEYLPKSMGLIDQQKVKVIVIKEN